MARKTGCIDDTLRGVTRTQQKVRHQFSGQMDYTRALVLLCKTLFPFSRISAMLTAFSGISEPITGMFVLISMHLSWWFQI